MDRRFYEIQQSMIDAKESVSNLSALEITTSSEQTINTIDATSKVSIWRLFIWIFSFALWNHEKIVERNAKNSRPQSLENLRQDILNFHDGLDLVWTNGSFSYDHTAVDDAENRKIIKRCSILESNDGQLVIKIAGIDGPVSPEQEARVVEYIRQIKVPGVSIRLVNKDPDLLKLNLTVYVDQQIIDLANGNLLNVAGAVNPSKLAIDNYLSNLEFNGAFVKDHLRTALKNSEGITFAVINNLEWKYDMVPFSPVGEWKVPEAGYFKIEDSDLTINYLSDVLVNG